MRFYRPVLVLTVLACFALELTTHANELSDEEVAAYKSAWSAAIDRVTPDGYLYEELRRCAGCHETARDSAGNSTHRNAIGVTGDPRSPTLTGKGWLSGAHGRSQDSDITSNTFCAWCHAPSQPGVTDDIGAGQPVESGRTGISCITCHASEAVNDEYGTYQANFRPGGDRESLVDFVPRQPTSGAETNAQCLFCHLRPHSFAVQPHTDLGRHRRAPLHRLSHGHLQRHRIWPQGALPQHEGRGQQRPGHLQPLSRVRRDRNLGALFRAGSIVFIASACRPPV